MAQEVPGVLLLAGPTCSGKSELALELAERFAAEIVGADSRQIYRGMPIGTAAPSVEQRARVPHHLIGFLDPHERYNAARFTLDALAAIAAIHARGKRALVVGGTGFYLRALAGDVALSPAFDARTRARLAREVRVHPADALHDWLRARDPARAAAVAPGDTYRIARALEIALAPPADGVTGPAPSLRAACIPFVKIVLDVPSDAIDARIDARIDAMLAQGLIAEAERIGSEAIAASAVGYPHVFAYLAGQATLGELRTSLARETRRYAKRQRTWFRSEPGVIRASPTQTARFAVELLGWSLSQEDRAAT